MTVGLVANDLCWCGSGRKYKRCHKREDLSGIPAAATRTRVVKGVLSPTREVPAHIARPDYADDGEPKARGTGAPKSAAEIVRMRAAGRAAAEVLAIVGAAVRPGITTDDLDAIAHAETIARGAYPSPLNYHGFPKSLCTSVNEVICHGIPDSTLLNDGDIVNCDVTVYLDGVHGDTNATFLVGAVDEESQRLVTVTRECLDHGIAAVRPGALVRDIGRAIQSHAESNGFGVVRSFIGHGIGATFHADPQIPHYYDPKARTPLREGMTFTIEPMITLGSYRHAMWDDDWTAVTTDLRRTAQFEHTVLVTPDGAEILTLP